MSFGNRIRVCYVLSYYSPNYARTNTLLEALEKIPSVTPLEATNRSTGLKRYAETLFELLRIRIRHSPDCFVLGFRGIEIFWIVRFLTLGKPLYFDHMMSPYDSLVNETARLSKEGVFARFVFWYEKSVLHAADAVLTDTSLHKEYFEQLFSLPSEKVHAVPIGADRIFCCDEPARHKPCDLETFTVLFYGSFLPLHGIDFILGAAVRLKDLPIEFVLIGGNRLDLSEFFEKIERLKLDNVQHKRWVEYQALPGLITRSNLCLGGPFGNTGQAQRVVTGKTVQCLAAGKPTVIGAIDDDFGFADRVNCLIVPQGDSQRLAETIRWAYEHQDELGSIGRMGRRLFLEQFSTQRIAKTLSEILLK